jgi:hypothetical protein
VGTPQAAAVSATVSVAATSTIVTGNQIARSTTLRVIALSTTASASSPTTTQIATGSQASGNGAQTGMPPCRATIRATAVHTTAAITLEMRR